MTALRILNLVVWVAMFAYMLPGALAAVTSKARYGDPMRLACALTAIVFSGFNLFWLFGPGHVASDNATLNFLLILSAALGAYIFKLGATYGRGALLKGEGQGDE